MIIELSYVIISLAATTGRAITPYHQKGGNIYIFKIVRKFPAGIDGGVTGSVFFDPAGEDRL